MWIVWLGQLRTPACPTCQPTANAERIKAKKIGRGKTRAKEATVREEKKEENKAKRNKEKTRQRRKKEQSRTKPNKADLEGVEPAQTAFDSWRLE